MDDLDAGPRRDLGPDVTTALGALPVGAPALSGNGDETERAARPADAPRVAPDDRALLPFAGRGEPRTQAADACTDNSEVVALHAALPPPREIFFPEPIPPPPP